MDKGLSLAWGEVIEAKELDHELTKDLQIVCPCCFESVIKVERPTRDGRTIDYLSHRPGPGAELLESHKRCELRVASLTKEDVERLRAISRGQSLVAFLDVAKAHITDVVQILDAPACGVDLASGIDNILSDGSLSDFISMCNDCVPPQFTAHLASTLLNPSRVKFFFAQSPTAPFMPPISDRTTTDGLRFASDLLKHLNTDQARSNWHFLLASAMVNLFSRTSGSANLMRLAEKTISRAVADSEPEWDVITAAWIEPVLRAGLHGQSQFRRMKLEKTLCKRFKFSEKTAASVFQKFASSAVYMAAYEVASLAAFAPIMSQARDRMNRGSSPDTTPTGGSNFNSMNVGIKLR